MPASGKHARAKNHAIPRFFKIGRRPALYNHSYTSGRSSTLIPRSGWGGARNSKQRTSNALTLVQAERIIAAANFAYQQKLPLNRFVTVNWSVAGVADRDAADATHQLLRLMRDWLRKQGQGFAHLWIRENGTGHDRVGTHVHILMHVDPAISRTFAGKTRRWIRAVTGRRCAARTIATRRIGGRLDAAWTSPEKYRINLAYVVAYVLKGTAAEAAWQLRLPRIRNCGTIIGKRCGWSQNIGDTARKRCRCNPAPLIGSTFAHIRLRSKRVLTGAPRARARTAPELPRPSKRQGQAAPPPSRAQALPKHRAKRSNTPGPVAPAMGVLTPLATPDRYG